MKRLKIIVLWLMGLKDYFLNSCIRLAKEKSGYFFSGPGQATVQLDYLRVGQRKAGSLLPGLGPFLFAERFPGEGK
jgi:hypothetical protein